MTWLQAFVMGAVQGLTEFLPVSSSAHLILFPWALGWEDPGLAFDAFLHLGTIFAVFVYFLGDWFRLLKAGTLSILERKVGYDPDRLLFWLLIFGTFPAGIAGLLFNDLAETTFRSPLLIAATLSFVGFLLYWVDGHYPNARRVEELRGKDAFWIGIAQACAIVPGVSRSGATMTMARLLGVNREAAARFSFLLSFPIILAAGLFKGRELITGAAPIDVKLAVSGLAGSVIFGLLSIHVLLRLLRVADFALFAWYRILLGAGILIFSAVSGK